MEKRNSPIESSNESYTKKQLDLIGIINNHISSVKTSKINEVYYFEEESIGLECWINSMSLNNDDYWNEDEECYDQQEMFDLLNDLDDDMLELIRYEYTNDNRENLVSETIEMIKFLLPLETTYHFKLFLRTTNFWRVGIDMHDCRLSDYKNDMKDYFNKDTISWILFILPKKSMI